MNKNKWNSTFKICRIVLFFFILFFFLLDYFSPDASYFTVENISILCLAFIILIIDLFDSIQIGTILKINREKEIAEKENQLLKDQNATLVNMVTSINQKVSVTNNFAEVKQATDEEQKDKIIQEEFQNDETLQQCENPNIEELKEQNKPIKIKEPKKESEPIKIRESQKDSGYIKIEKLESTLLEDYINKFRASIYTIIRNAKIETKHCTTIYDGYIKGKDIERFIEVELYVPTLIKLNAKLDTIKEYTRLNNTNAQLVLIIPKNIFEKTHTKSICNWNYRLERVNNLFKDEIKNGLLSIVLL